MEKLVEAIAYLREFESDFHLTIANHKTSAWTNMRRQQQMLEEATVLSVQDHFSALEQAGPAHQRVKIYA